MVKKATIQSQDHKHGVQDDAGVDMSLSNTVYNDWCKRVSIENPTSVPCVMSDMVQDGDLSNLVAEKS